MGFALDAYADIAIFQPVVNGVGGNLVAIFASRLSTALHRTSTQGSVPFWAPTKWYTYPFHTFMGSLSMLGLCYNLKEFYLMLFIKLIKIKRP